MKQPSKLTLALVVAIVVLILLAIFKVYEVHHERATLQPAPQHGSYPYCEYRTVKGACGMWTIKTY